jgi:hypothetical protein
VGVKTATRRFALWRADLEGGVCAAPEECVAALRDDDAVPVVLEHREHGITPTRHVFAGALAEDGEWQFHGIVWPADLPPGVLVTVTWQPRASDPLVVRTTALDEPVRVDGVHYFHEYDPKVVTREYEPDTSNRSKVLHAIRREGRVFSDGSAVLAESDVARRCGLGRGARGTFLLRNAVDQLIREGFLTRVEGSVDPAGYPAYPAVDGQRTAAMLFYAPMVDEVPMPDGAERPEHWVNGFVRKLPPGAQPSERQLSLHDQAVEEEEIDAGPLAPGYTFVKRHHRGH